MRARGRCDNKNENTRNWFRYETFIYLFEFKVFRHEERETQLLSILAFPSESTTCGPRCKLLVWPRQGLKIDLLRPASNLTSLVWSLNLNSLFFLWHVALPCPKQTKQPTKNNVLPLSSWPLSGGRRESLFLLTYRALFIKK